MDKNIHEKIEELTNRINDLARKQTFISNQLLQLIKELDALKQSAQAMPAQQQLPQQQQQTVSTITETVTGDAVTVTPVQPIPVQPGTTATRTTRPPRVAPQAKRDSSGSFEEFIGKNLASKVGILVTIIGIFIGAKYAIEHQMISETFRVIAAYVCGAALIGVAVRLKKKYEAYSSVLMGGGLAVLYFITYIAYSFYHLMPQTAAFALMLVFTAGTVFGDF